MQSIPIVHIVIGIRRRLVGGNAVIVQNTMMEIGQYVSIVEQIAVKFHLGLQAS